MSNATLNFFGEIDNAFCVSFSVISFFEFRFKLHGMVNCHWHTLRTHRNHFWKAIASVVWITKCARDVTYCTACHHRTECTDLCDFVSTIFTLCIFNHFVAAVVGEVHVDIGRRWTFWVEEAFEWQFIFERIHRCNTEYVRSHWSSDRSSNVGENVIFVRVAEQILHDEEVVRVAFHGNNWKLVVETFFGFGVILQTAALHTGIRSFFECFVGGFTCFKREFRKDKLAEHEVEFTHIGNLCCVFNCARNTFK